MTVAAYKWTIDRYHRAVEAGIFEDQPVELLNGVIVEMSPEGEPHAYFRTELRDYLTGVLGNRVKIREAAPITIPASNSEPEPDLAIVQPLGQEYLTHHPYPDNVFWLVEYSNSSLKKDLDVKSKVYATAGIPEYWVINLKSRELVVMRHPLNGDYSQVMRVAEVVYPLAFPDVAIVVSQVVK